MQEPVSGRLRAVGWTDRVAALAATATHHGTPGRVVEVARGAVTVATAAADLAVPTHEPLAVGDWVVVDDAAGGVPTLEALPRWSALGRLDPEGRRQVLAANVDVVLVVAPADRLSPARVERELVLAWDSGARPVVVLSKADLASEGAADGLRDRLTGADLVVTSAHRGDGLDELRSQLGPGTTGAMIGPSGAGKSSLLNAIAPGAGLAVGEVRADDHRGRHTTTARRLVPLPGGGTLVDMPGLRSLALDAEAASLATAFPDVDELAGDCRFRDCTHGGEPGCAVVAAAGAGGLDPARLASYRKLQREVAFERRRDDPLARQAEARRWKATTRALRRRARERGERDR
jgi:ribosome biogenesis GTPase